MRKIFKTILITFLIFCFSVSNVFAAGTASIKDDSLIVTGAVFDPVEKVVTKYDIANLSVVKADFAYESLNGRDHIEWRRPTNNSWYTSIATNNRNCWPGVQHNFGSQVMPIRDGEYNIVIPVRRGGRNYIRTTDGISLNTVISADFMINQSDYKYGYDSVTYNNKIYYFNPNDLSLYSNNTTSVKTPGYRLIAAYSHRISNGSLGETVDVTQVNPEIIEGESGSEGQWTNSGGFRANLVADVLDRYNYNYEYKIPIGSNMFYYSQYNGNRWYDTVYCKYCHIGYGGYGRLVQYNSEGDDLKTNGRIPGAYAQYSYFGYAQNSTAFVYASGRLDESSGFIQDMFMIPMLNNGGKTIDEIINNVNNFKPGNGNQMVSLEYAGEVDISGPVWRNEGLFGAKEVHLKNCTSTNYTINKPIIIDSGAYSGAPTSIYKDKFFIYNDQDINLGYTSDPGRGMGILALNNSGIIVNKGTIIDYSSKEMSKFLNGEESDSSSVITEDKTVTTVKLSNPPIIIDWGTMPPLDINWDGLDLDFNAPTIEVTRNPANQKQPAASVTLTIRTTDPDGNDSPTPISINGGTFVASPATYTAREKEVVNISARDSKGNVRDYSVNISNIDTEAPYVTSMTQSNTVWTKTPVVVTVKAEDDVKLHATPYKYEFTPNSTGHTTVSGWTANRTFSATENGTLRVGVRDTLYTNDSNTEHFSWSEPYYIRNIDKISPSATVAYSVPSSQKVSEKVGVTVYVTPVDNADSVTGESSGISNTPIAWTEGAFTAQLEKTFYANGTYYFWIKDALGNISARQSVTINQIVSDNTTKPVINSLSQNKTTGQVSAPVTITVNASKGLNGPNLSNQPFSWDGGVTWTNNPNFDVNKNGTYTVIVKDTNGNTTEQSITISNIDDNKPTASLFLYKGQPEDWDMAYGPALVTDYVWKLRVEANDLGSGLQQVVTNWDNRTINTPSTPFTTVFDVTEPGVYGVKVIDKCGNETYVEKTITAESIGAGIWGVGGGSTGGTGGTGTGTGGKGFGTIIDVPSTGSAGSSIFPGGASLQDLVFSPNSVYNIATGEIKGYPPGKAGIPIHLLFTATRNHYVTGTATFNGVEYPLYFPENGNANWIKSIGRQNVAEGFIPINTVTSDVKNGRIKISFKEYSDQSLSTLVSEGSATLYTSTQITKPTIGYVYNKATDQLTVNASTTVAGVDKVQVDLGSGYQDYTGPVTVGGASTIKVKVTDKAGNVSEITIDGSTLPMTGSSGGSIPTNDKDNVGATGSDGDAVNSYHTSNRSADIFIVGGNRSNTNSVPDSSIYDLTD